MRVRRAWLDTLRLDLRYALRQLARAPIVATTAVLSLAIGIGAVTAIATLANGAVLRSAPGIANPGTLVDVVRSRSDREIGIEQISFPDYLDLTRRTRTLRDVFGFTLQPDAVSFARAPDRPVERAFATVVTPNYFTSLGVAAYAGRLFTADDGDRGGGRAVAVLSHRFWTRRFNADPATIGTTIRLNGHLLTVAGVAPDGFRGTTIVAPDLWITTASVAVVAPDAGIAQLDDRLADWLMVSARLAPGTTRGQASGEVAAIGAALARESPAPAIPMPGRRPLSYEWRVESSSPVPAGVRSAAAGFLTLLFAIVAIVLLVSCANVAGVLLARATARRREIALRLAIGASRGRIIRQLLTESALLVLIGGAAGVAIARGVTTLLIARLPALPIPVVVSAPIDAGVLVFALATTALAVVIAGLMPALDATRADAAPVLKDDTQSAPDRVRLRGAFVVAQVALSLLLVVIASLLMSGLDRITSVDRGYDASGVEIASIDLSMGGYTRSTGPAALGLLLDGLQQMPAVDGATVADRAPGGGGRSLGPIAVPGVTAPDGSPFFFPVTTLVAPGYFGTLRIPLVAGRDFTRGDRQGSEPVAIIEQTMAERFWPDGSAVGRAIMLQPSERATGALEMIAARIVGVVGGPAASNGPRRGAGFAIYLPIEQRYSARVTVLARGRDGRGTGADLRAAIAAFDRTLPLLAQETLERHQDGPVETQLRIGATVAAGVGAIALLLAAVGVYGVTAYAAARRTREIGIRIALGAKPSDVVRFVARHGGRLVAIGSGTGVVLGVIASRAIAGPRFSVPAAGPALFAGAVLAIAAIGIVACYLPARRAARTPPLDALRAE